jgi:hypothetical protein
MIVISASCKLGFIFDLHAPILKLSMLAPNTTFHHNPFGNTGDGTIKRTNAISPITPSVYAFCTRNA